MRKKWFAWALLVCLLLSSAVAQATGFYFLDKRAEQVSSIPGEDEAYALILEEAQAFVDALDEEELRALREVMGAGQDWNGEIDGTDEVTPGKPVTVPIGIYEVGAHIPAGDYTITTDSYASVTVALGEDVGDYEQQIFWETFDETGSIGRLPLKEGQFVRVEYAPVVFTPFAGLGF